MSRFDKSQAWRVCALTGLIVILAAQCHQGVSDDSTNIGEYSRLDAQLDREVREAAEHLGLPEAVTAMEVKQKMRVIKPDRDVYKTLRFGCPEEGFCPRKLVDVCLSSFVQNIPQFVKFIRLNVELALKKHANRLERFYTESRNLDMFEPMRQFSIAAMGLGGGKSNFNDYYPKLERFRMAQDELDVGRMLKVVDDRKYQTLTHDKKKEPSERVADFIGHRCRFLWAHRDSFNLFTLVTRFLHYPLSQTIRWILELQRICLEGPGEIVANFQKQVAQVRE